MSKLTSPGLKLGRKAIPLLYGTAWNENTAEATKTALKLGFGGLDTANYPTAYDEPGTGDGIAATLNSGIARESLFIQSKFTPAWAHDKDKIPYNPDQDIEGQIRESLNQTFEHLKIDYLDALLLHAPFEKDDDNITAWKVFEEFVPHKVRYLGISNSSLSLLQDIYDAANVKPVIVQNMFSKESGYDVELRKTCQGYGILYQAFSVIRHNSGLLDSGPVAMAAEKLNVGKEVALYVLVLCLGDTQVLDGTSKEERMEHHLQVIADVTTSDDQLKRLEPSIEAFKVLLEKGETSISNI